MEANGETAAGTNYAHSVPHASTSPGAPPFAIVLPDNGHPYHVNVPGQCVPFVERKELVQSICDTWDQWDQTAQRRLSLLGIGGVG